MKRRVIPGLALAAAFAVRASAQQAVYLQPLSFKTAGPVAVRLLTADGPQGWNAGQVGWLYVRGQGTQENMDQPPAPDAAGAVALPAAPAGAAAIGIDFKPRVVEIDAAVLRTLAATRCDLPLPDTVKGKVRLELAQSCKTLVRVGNDPRAHDAALTEAMQAAEIATAMDPTAMRAGGDLAITTSIEGADLEDARVLVTNLTTGASTEVRTREEGFAHIPTRQPGVYRVEFHHLARASDPAKADWRLTSATLTFEVAPAKAEGAK